MSVKSWETLKMQYCDQACQEVALEAEVIYPADMLPDQPPRLLGHRCSQGAICNQFNKNRCIWAGTNPTFDPFEAG